MDSALIRKWSLSRILPEQVAAFMAREIESGQIEQWEPLPDTEQMAEELGVSKSTVLRAKRLLVENGVAEKQDGFYVRS
jgi:DNA-binding GntR family transcriptional regulator